MNSMFNEKTSFLISTNQHFTILTFILHSNIYKLSHFKIFVFLATFAIFFKCIKRYEYLNSS